MEDLSSGEILSQWLLRSLREGCEDRDQPSGVGRLGEVGHGNRKDVRNAVEAARNNRLDLMTLQGQVTDAWRQVGVNVTFASPKISGNWLLHRGHDVRRVLGAHGGGQQRERGEEERTGSHLGSSEETVEAVAPRAAPISVSFWLASRAASERG